MKRIVQCPKCEAKLSVFDLGKPISQKCPKCSNTFDVASEGGADAADNPSGTSPAPTGETPVKEIKLKPPTAPAAASRPAASAEPQPEPVVVESGISFMHVLVIFALLFTIIVVQVVTFKKTESQLNALADKVQTLNKKSAQP